MNFTALQTKTTSDFSINLQKLELLILNCKQGSFIVAPELAVTGYSYDNMQNAVDYSLLAIKSFLKLSKDRTIALTLMTKQEDGFYNTLHIFHQEKIVYTQHKHKIFVLNDEKKYFKAGLQEAIQVVQVGNLKVAALICFELRFIELWQQIQGADVILIPAYWGVQRKDNYEALCKALAIANQCFVIASDCSNEECAKGSAIISPLGHVYQDDIKELLTLDVDLNEIKQVRQHLDIGIPYE